MNNPINTFIEYLLDTQTTSDVLFNDTILKEQPFYERRYLSNYEEIINRKFQQWKDYYQKEQRTIAERIAPKTENESSEESSDSNSEDDNEEEDGVADDDDEKSSKPVEHTKTKITRPIEQLEAFLDPVGQCKRLLQFLYHCQQDHRHFTELYLRTLERCVRFDDENIIATAFQQIALHLTVDDDTDHPRLVKILPRSSEIRQEHQPILSTIHTLLRTKQNKIAKLSSDEFDILYPQTARFLDLRREFRDSAHYFIDGDSLILSIAHHINIDLKTYFGNTLHVLFIIERILLHLFNQAHQCNYTILFFDCHYQIYRNEPNILHLLRTCLIAHLSRNTAQHRSTKIQQFSSWLSEEYRQFVSQEKPHFIFYDDLASFVPQKNCLLTENTLKYLRYVYRLFGNYHQYHLQCHLYLMNKLILTDITVMCFEVKFHNQCSKKLMTKMIGESVSDRKELKQWIELEEKMIDCNDARLFIYLVTIKQFQGIDERFHRLVPLLLLHVALLIRLSLIDRHVPLHLPHIEFSVPLSNLLKQFQHSLAFTLSSYSSNLSYTKIADLFDGRLFAFTIYRLHQTSPKIFFDVFTLEIVDRCLDILQIANDDYLFNNKVNELIQSKDIIISPSMSTVDSMEGAKLTITRVSNGFMDTFLQPILSRKSDLSFEFVDPDDEHHSSRYEGRYHWHVYKEVGDEIKRVRDNDEQHRNSSKYRYRTKNQQKFYTYFTLYGNSLTTRDVRDNHLQITLPVASIEEATSASNTTDGKKQKVKGASKPIPQKKADKIREENRQHKLEKRMDDEADQISNVEELLKKISIDDHAKMIETIDQSLQNFQTSDYRLKLLKRKFRSQRKYLQNLRKRTTLTLEEQTQIDLLQINFFATMTEMARLENVGNVFEKKKEYLEELVQQSPLDLETWYRFQLTKVNSRVPRREQGVPDRRVPDFIPDKWQVDFLDAVDKQQSIIIVAPTASGKTYASYYAMNRVLKDNNDPYGICVYIAPTKALVNQVAATIHSKFGAVFGIFTRDYRTNMSGCRILVTVPQCMEILLLSPNHQRWCQRIKYAIFDEIHCMSVDSGSDVWEKTMLLINCPMIGLSATVNNGEEMCQWIQHVEDQRAKLFQQSKARRVRLIIHHERMADLNKYLYTNRQLFPVHPVGIMNGKQLINQGLPKDFSLSPCETLQLHDAMKTVSPDLPLPNLTESFSHDWIIERSICNGYSRLVCQQFEKLIETKNNVQIDTIATSLQPRLSNGSQYPQMKQLGELIVEFILTLKEKNLLPCIVFTDNRILCEQMAASVAKHFENLEKNLRETKYKNQIDALHDRLENQILKKNKAKKEKKPSSKRNHDEDNIEEYHQMEEEENNHMFLSGLEQQLLDGILDEGTLTNQRDSDRKLVDALLERAGSDNPRLISYMKRGVAYHHAGLNNKGRVAVEALFRNRFIQVVFSTATLALGIHMPTKTVAFVNDSIYLDALQYRQSSGRAGRRGFDIQGHVIFVDIPLPKIRHLIISAIPNIHAHFPTSVTFLLRLLHLYSNADDSQDAMNRSLIALECPLLSQSPMTKDLVDVQTRFHALFTLDFLYRINLVNGQGDLVGLAGLLTHLHYFEPANILLIYLMQTQLFDVVKNPADIVTILAYLFTNRPWLITQKKYESLCKNRKDSKFNSRLFLPSLSREVRKRIDQYNAIVKEVYGGYIDNVNRYLRSMNNNQIETLPFSHVSFAQSTVEYDDGSFEYQLHHHQSQQTLNPSISPFAALSGLTHEKLMLNYNPTVGSWDLAYDLDLSSKIVPFIDIDCRDHTNATYHLNSYVLDFFRHGSEKLLIAENELSTGDTYGLLLDFRLVLSSVATSLKIIVKDEEKKGQSEDLAIFAHLFQSFSGVESAFNRHFQRQYPSRNQL